jgi:hypothetical protein
VTLEQELCPDCGEPGCIGDCPQGEESFRLMAEAIYEYGQAHPEFTERLRAQVAARKAKVT